MAPVKSLYFHIPFCVRRCNYCDFTTFSGMDKWIPAYIKALEKEIILAVKDEPERTHIHTVFFGGGTPSIVPAYEYERILEVVRSSFILETDVEMSFEANPGTIQDRDMSEYKRIGFNRVSLGVQSFNVDELDFLGRIHNTQDVYDAVKVVRKAGFDNMNIDLIYGVPGQTMSSWDESLKRALDLGPEHLSLYCLTIEEGTPLVERVKNSEIVPLDEDEAAEMYELAMFILDEAGYRHYEISNWAKISTGGKDYRCRHNLQYWKNEEYYGFGVGAHGYINNMRIVNFEEIPTFISSINQAENAKTLYKETIVTNLKERMQDEMMLGLRLVDEGVSATGFKLKFGYELTAIFEKEISRLIRSKLIQWTDGNGTSIILTEKGTLLGNQVFMEFVGDQNT